MKNDLTTFDSLTIEALTEACKDAFEECAPALVILTDNWKRLETFRRLLTAAKNKVPHGEWANWITDTFAGRLAIRTAQRWMSDSNAPLLAHLDDAADPPRSSRKTGQVTTHKPAEEPEENTPSPGKGTTRRTSSAATGKAEQVSDRANPVVADKGNPESPAPAKKPVQAELLPDPPAPMSIDPVSEWIGATSLTDVVARWVEVSVDPKDEKRTKEVAKRLRKLADKLDPPTKFVPPSLEDVTVYFSEQHAAGRNAAGVPPDDFFDFYESKGWVVGKVGMKDWRSSARKWIRTQEAEGCKNGHSKREQTHAEKIAARVKSAFG